MAANDEGEDEITLSYKGFQLALFMMLQKKVVVYDIECYMINLR